MSTIASRPFLKWAGGKTQLLPSLLPLVPQKFNTYLEPFLGGGALFFALAPKKAILSDANPELINVYTQIRDHLNSVIKCLAPYQNDKELFYHVRSLNWQDLDPAEAAARFIFLNRTCFNGLYRVNRTGQFNVPFGNYKNPKILDKDLLKSASNALSKCEIINADYKDVVTSHAKEGDFIFFDPPYMPISEYSNFKRYTKEQFNEQDQTDLASTAKKLQSIGCHSIITNSNHPFIIKLYEGSTIYTHRTKRNINCNGDKRNGEDIIIVQYSNTHKQYTQQHHQSNDDTERLHKFPSTRYMGSKSKLIETLRGVCKQFCYKTAADIFSGSGIVSYMLKGEGKTVYSNDYMFLCSTWSKALIENKNATITQDEASSLLLPNHKTDKFVEKTFGDLYFTKSENVLIDNIRANIWHIEDEYKKSLALSALTRACFKKRPRGIFTYTGHRYDDGRRDLKTSFEEHFINAISTFNNAVFDNGQDCFSTRCDALDFTHPVDLVYIDPPYYSTQSDNEYIRRYHFIEGLARNWEGVDIQWNTKTRKFKNYPTPFSKKETTHQAFKTLFSTFSDSIIIVSYSSNSLPTLAEMKSLLKTVKRHIEILEIDYRYHVGNHGHCTTNNKNNAKEYIFIGYDS